MLMKKLGNLLMKGFATILPVALTIYVIWWLATTAETLLRRFITIFVPEEQYWPGLGLIVGFVILLAVGAMVNAYLVRRAIRAWEELLGRIPVVKTIYGAIRDLTNFLPSGDQRRDLRSVVVYRFNGARIVGFVTRDDLPELEAQAGGIDLVAVYFPMSYALGGYTLYLPKSEVEILDMPVETAMRMVLTGAMSTTPAKPARRR
jgi:uncharacterized membrane protein